MCTRSKGAIRLETEEDIRKWREERRKNFPTKARIAEKEAARKAGTSIETKKFSKREQEREKRRAEKLKKKILVSRYLPFAFVFIIFVHYFRVTLRPYEKAIHFILFCLIFLSLYSQKIRSSVLFCCIYKNLNFYFLDF